MKKVFSSIFACIAMIGLLTSCVEEKIETTFEVDAAEAYISVQVINLATAENVTAQSTITSSPGSVSGNVVMLVGNNTITETTVDVTAAYTSPNGNKYTTTQPVIVNALRAGGKAYYNIVINVGEITPTEDYTFKYVAKVENEVTEDTYFDKATIKESGKTWAHNESEYLLRGTVTYQIWSGCDVYADAPASDFWAEKFDHFVADFEKTRPFVKEDKTANITVSAWSYYTAYVTRTVQDTKATWYAVDKMGNEQEVGTIHFWNYPSCVYYTAEMASPSHAAHYIAGHGHDDVHGHSSGHGGNNAGGGIVFAD